jgi:hypothetical protein
MIFGILPTKMTGKGSGAAYHLEKGVSDAARGRYCQGIPRLELYMRRE